MEKVKNIFKLKFFVLLLPLWPILEFINKNKYQPSFYIDDLLIFILAAVLFLPILYTILHFIFSKIFSAKLIWQFVLLLSAILCYLQRYYDFKIIFFTVGDIDLFDTEKLKLLSFSYITAGIIFTCLFWLIGSSKKLSELLGLVSLIFIVSPIVYLLRDSGDIGARFLDRDIPSQINYTTVQDSKDLPNVYFFVYDGYMRSDALKKYYDFDNEEFIKELKELNFHTITDSYSNFGSTRYALNYAYNPSLSKLDKVEMLKKLNALYSYNGEDSFEIANVFRSLGYDFSMLSFTGEGKKKACGDKCIIIEQDLSFTTLQLIKNTPIYDVATKFYPGLIFNWLTKIPNDNRHAIKNLPKNLEEPYLMVSHVLLPHPPYSVNEECNYLYNDFMDVQGVVNFNLEHKWDVPQTRKRYLQQVACANKQMIDIAEWLQDNDKDAIAFFVSDHGWKNDFAISKYRDIDWSRVSLRNRNFMSVSLPEHCQQDISDSMTLINMFPLALGCITNKPVEFYPDKIYRINGEGKNKFIVDFTDIITAEN